MVRSGRSAGLTPAPCAAAIPGLASDETAAADTPRNPRRELVFDIVTSLVYSVRPYLAVPPPENSILVHRRPPRRPPLPRFCNSRRHANSRHGLAPLRLLQPAALRYPPSEK